jgi:hypothetical protein
VSSQLVPSAEFAVYNHRKSSPLRPVAAIVSGPTWIDFDRFNVIAKISSLKAQLT